MIFCNMLNAFFKRALLACGVVAPIHFSAQTTGADTLAPISVPAPVIIESTRADDKTPMTFTNLRKKDLQELNTGQDVPFLLRFTPSLVATSDAGNGIGYTGLWIRGSDPSRINITINGVPLNDPESQQVFWVNLPDFASSTNSIQIQRGVGTSTNGAASFGGTIKMETTGVETRSYTELSNMVGSFNTMRNAVKFGTGLIGDRFILEGRLSNIRSDGYIDRASARLQSAYLAGTWLMDRTIVRFTGFSGREVTYQSWYGTPESRLNNDKEGMINFAANNELDEAQTNNLLNSGRTYNFYTYDNQVDNYGQDHAQLHITHSFNEKWNANGALHYTKGQGYFEEFRAAQSFGRYGLPDLILTNDTIRSTDLVRQRWLDNHFYGAVFSLRYKGDKLETILGGGWNEYLGDHFGDIVWMQYQGDVPKDFRYYEGKSTKRDGNIYARSTYAFNDKWNGYADVQVRRVDYITQGVDNDLRAYDVNDQLLFVNPKAGVSWLRRKGEKFYFSAAVGQKEPNRNDYIDAPQGTAPRPESMLNIEVGWQYKGFAVNYYDMMYRDQLILTGAVNDVGAPLRTNVESSYRRGIEAEWNHRKGAWVVQWNATWSRNRIASFTEVIPDYLNGGEQRIEHTDTPIAFSPDWIAGGRIGYDFIQGIIQPRRTLKHEQHLVLFWMSRYVGRQYLDNTGNAERTIDPYFVNDIRCEYTVKWRKVEVAASLVVNNALSTLYASNGYTFSYLFGDLYNERFFYPQAIRNYLLQLDLRF
jgi:iron complex outermembrane recepter protein